MDEPRRMRLIDNPSVAGPVVGEGRDYITIENETTEDVTRSREAFEPAPPAEPAPGTLTDRQTKALDWILQVCIEHTAEQATGLEPDQAVEEICDLASVVELLPPGEVHDRLFNLCEEIRREQQVRLDALLAQEEAEQTPEQKLRAALEGLLATSALNEDSIEPEDQSLVDNALAVLEETKPHG